MPSEDLWEYPSQDTLDPFEQEPCPCWSESQLYSIFPLESRETLHNESCIDYTSGPGSRVYILDEQNMVFAQDYSDDLFENSTHYCISWNANMSEPHTTAITALQAESCVESVVNHCVDIGLPVV